jgi:hypothetical protein
VRVPELFEDDNDEKLMLGVNLLRIFTGMQFEMS